MTSDVAILVLDSDSSITPVAYGNPPADGATSTVIGWGTLTSGGSSPDALMQVDVPVWSNTECNGASAYDGGIDGTMICAGYGSGPFLYPSRKLKTQNRSSLFLFGKTTAMTTRQKTAARATPGAHYFLRTRAAMTSSLASSLGDTAADPVRRPPTNPWLDFRFFSHHSVLPWPSYCGLLKSPTACALRFSLSPPPPHRVVFRFQGLPGVYSRISELNTLIDSVVADYTSPTQTCSAPVPAPLCLNEDALALDAFVDDDTEDYTCSDLAPYWAYSDLVGACATKAFSSQAELDAWPCPASCSKGSLHIFLCAPLRLLLTAPREPPPHSAVLWRRITRCSLFG